MFPRRYFPGRMFAARYWAQSQGSAPPVTITDAPTWYGTPAEWGRTWEGTLAEQGRAWYGTPAEQGRTWDGIQPERGG